jgi:arsenate reductase
MSVTIYHNPGCGTSRTVLAMIRETGEEPNIVEYLKSPPDRPTLIDLMTRMNITPRDLLRRKGQAYERLIADLPSLTDEQALDAMLAQPILLERPIVVTERGVRLCRPSERVLEILPPGLRQPAAS